VSRLDTVKLWCVINGPGRSTGVVHVAGVATRGPASGSGLGDPPWTSAAGFTALTWWASRNAPGVAWQGADVGQFIYNSMLTITVNDTVLAHLEAVIGTKFRREESFYFSWTWHVNSGENRTTIWLNPQTAVQFRYLSSSRPVLDRTRLAQMLLQANTATGLSLVIDRIPPSTDRIIEA